MRRLPLLAFAALAAATVAAFFVVQHLKAGTPLINGFPRPSPGTISPTGTGCASNARVARLSFYLQHRADDAAVYIVDSTGTIVRTLSTGRHMRQGVRFPDGSFPWDGRDDAGRIVPDGTYYWRVALLHQGRTVQLPVGVQVLTRGPRPRVTHVSPALLPAPDGAPADVQITGTENRITRVTIYRTDGPGAPRALTSFKIPGRSRFELSAQLGLGSKPAPAGTYLVGLYVADPACNVGRFPTALPPPRGTTPHAGVSVRYLAAESPPIAVAPGRSTSVLIDARRRPYTWQLERAGKRVAGGRGDGPVLTVPVPRRGAGAYALALRAGAARTAVPLLAGSGRSGAGAPPVLVVLPALTWQGLNPVDDDGDGMPNLLSTGGPVGLDRVLANGLPADYPAEAALLDALDRAHLPYEVTTDLAIIRGTGPALTGYPGVILAGEERWITPGLAAGLRAFVRGGGRLVSLGGSDALRRTVTVTGSQALDPGPPSATDIFGVRAGAPIHAGALITSSRDDLGLFSGTAGVFTGFPSASTFVAGPGVTFVSSAGTGGDAAAIAALPVGRGTVVEVGLPGLGSAAAHGVDAQELLARLWHVAANR